MTVNFNRKHLLGIRELEAGEITHLLDTAETFRDISKREIKKVPALRGRTVINLFFESSTRTRTSFEIAAKRLSADAVNISVPTSSMSKGETLLDTARNLEAMSPDCIVVRHSMAGAPQHLARMGNAPIVNAGDGSHEHPTQALLDALTIREYKKRIAGLKVAILGDVLHSRVARSNIHAGIFMGVHFLFLWELFSDDWARKIHGIRDFIDQMVIGTGLWVPLLALFIVRGALMLFGQRETPPSCGTSDRAAPNTRAGDT